MTFGLDGIELAFTQPPARKYSFAVIGRRHFFAFSPNLAQAADGPNRAIALIMRFDPG
jgi:hypothetical protein